MGAVSCSCSAADGITTLEAVPFKSFTCLVSRSGLVLVRFMPLMNLVDRMGATLEAGPVSQTGVLSILPLIGQMDLESEAVAFTADPRGQTKLVLEAEPLMSLTGLALRPHTFLRCCPCWPACCGSHAACGGRVGSIGGSPRPGWISATP